MKRPCRLAGGHLTPARVRFEAAKAGAGQGVLPRAQANPSHTRPRLNRDWSAAGLELVNQPPGLGVVRFQSEHFLELAERLAMSPGA